jgi:hypothetical protein
MFVFDQTGGYDERFATAEGQLHDDPAGVISDEQA